MVIEKQAITLEDLLALGEDACFEIINWEKIDMAPAGGTHQLIARNILWILETYVRENDSGVVLPDQMTYLMNSTEGGLKDSYVPDVSYFTHDNVPEGWDVDKPHPGAPDLAVEIISPNDNAEIVQTKVQTYLAQGTQEVWLVFPKTLEVHQHSNATPDAIRKYTGSVAIETALFPNIHGMTTDAIFTLPAWATKSADDNQE